MRLSREQYMHALSRHSEASGSNYWGETKRGSSGGGGTAESLAVTGARASIGAWLPASTEYGAAGAGGGFLPALSRSLDSASAAHGFGDGAAQRGTKGFSAGLRSARDAGGVIGAGGATFYGKTLPLPSATATISHRQSSDGHERWSAAATADSGGGSGGRTETTSRATLYDLTQVSPLHPLGLAYGASASPSTMATSSGASSFLVRRERLSPSYPQGLPPPPPPAMSKILANVPRAGRLISAAACGAAAAAADPATAAAADAPGREDAMRWQRAETTGDETAGAAAAASALDGPKELITSSCRGDGDARSHEGRQEAPQSDEPSPPRLPQPTSASSKEQDAPKSILKMSKASLDGGGCGTEQSYDKALRGPLEGSARVMAHTYFLTLNHAASSKLSKVSASGGSSTSATDGSGGTERLHGEKAPPAGSRSCPQETTSGLISGRWDRSGSSGGRRTSATPTSASGNAAKSSPGAAVAVASASGSSEMAGSDGANSEGSSKSSPLNSADRKRSVRFRDSLYELKEFLPWEPIRPDAVDSSSTGRTIPVMRPYVV